MPAVSIERVQATQSPIAGYHGLCSTVLAMHPAGARDGSDTFGAAEFACVHVMELTIGEMAEHASVAEVVALLGVIFDVVAAEAAAETAAAVAVATLVVV